MARSPKVWLEVNEDDAEATVAMPKALRVAVEVQSGLAVRLLRLGRKLRARHPSL